MPTKVRLVKAMVFLVVMYGCESWTIKKAAAAAKLLQSCLTLCNAIDGSPPASSVPGILQARILEWVANSLSNELTLRIRWPQYWSFSFSIGLSSEYSEFISLGIDWFDLLAVQGTLKSLLLHYRSKA